MVQRQLSHLGFRSIVVEREAEAAALLRAGPPPLVVLIDRRYDCPPGAAGPTGGIDAWAAVPVLYLSADVGRSRPPSGAEPGLLAKPFAIEELEQFIERTLRRMAHTTR